MADDRPDRCETCRFWDPGADATGLCRAHPPVDIKRQTRGGYQWGRWPVTQDLDWCGEWQPQK